MIVLFWDIDGTLLTTGKAGVPAWEQAVREIVQRDFQLSSFRVAGLTDYQIAVRTFEMLDVPADEATIRRDGRPLRGAAAARSCRRSRAACCPNVREILEHMRGRSDVRSYLLTGNTRGGARAKLTHYDLFHYFLDGAFAEDAGDARDDCRTRAGAGARGRSRSPTMACSSIGDTPHDIECANAIGARTIAVATGGYTLDELESHRPWRAFDELPAAEEFARLIDGASRQA